MKTPFDRAFDLDFDGKLDNFEKIARDGLIFQMLANESEEEPEETEDNSYPPYESYRP